MSMIKGLWAQVRYPLGFSTEKRPCDSAVVLFGSGTATYPETSTLSGARFIEFNFKSTTIGLSAVYGMHLSAEQAGNAAVSVLRITPAGGAIGIDIAGITGVGLKIHRATSTGETIKAHCHQAADGVEQANEFKGESLSVTGGMTGLVADFIMAASGVASITGIMGIAHLGPGVTSTGGDVIGLSGGADIVGTMNGAGICVAGVVGGLMPMTGGTLTACKYFSALWASSMAIQAPASGESQLLLMTHGLGATLNQAIYLDASDRISEFAHFVNCATMISAKIDADVAYAHYRKLLVTVDGNAGWIYIEMAA